MLCYIDIILVFLYKIDDGHLTNKNIITRHTNIVFNGPITNLFLKKISQNRNQHQLSITLNDFWLT